MPTRKLIRTAEYPYHVRVRANNREWFAGGIHEVWILFTSLLEKTRKRYKLQIHDVTLMSNHIHLNVSTPDLNLDLAMGFLLSKASRGLSTLNRKINHQFGSRYKWTVVGNPYHYANVHKYVGRNPAKAKIVQQVESYPFSTFSRDFISHEGSLLTIPSPLAIEVPDDPFTYSEWINTPFKKEHDEVIGKALRRREFKLPKIENRHFNPLDKMLG
jgi:putative transposase